MLISCPKCNAVYEVPDSQIPATGKKFKCAECEEVWTAYPPKKETVPQTEQKIELPEDVKNDNTTSNLVVDTVKVETTQQKTNPAPDIKSQVVADETPIDDVQYMFERLSQDTKGLFSGKQSADTKWARFKRKFMLMFSLFMLNCTILLAIIAMTLYIGYRNRYEIVDALPMLENFYNKIGLESIHKNKDIVFQNVTTRNIKRKGKRFIEVSGLLFNNGNMQSTIIPIKAVMKRQDGSIESEAVKIMTLDRLEANFSAVFRMLLPSSSLYEKSITLSFDENAKEIPLVDEEEKNKNKKRSPFDEMLLKENMNVERKPTKQP